MPHRLTYDFRREREFNFEQASGTFLAIVDLDSYPASPDSAGGSFDRFDLLQHLCAQMDALTATMWETPDSTLRLRLVLAEDHFAVEDLHRSGHHVFADGWVRSGGRLCLAGHDHLLNFAQHPGLPLPGSRATARESASRTLLVPPGTYAVTVFSGVAHGGGDEPNYIIVLRHYPPPPPRLQPIRLRGMVPWPATDAQTEWLCVSGRRGLTPPAAAPL